MRAVCLQHVAAEQPFGIGAALLRAGHQVTVCRVDLGEPLPRVEDLDVLVVLGGPMHAHDDAGHPHLAAERELLRAAVDARLPVLGVCLGAQLLAAAHGARVARGPAPELGLGEVRLSGEGLRDPLLGPGPDPLPVLHWHEDGFDLPPDAVLLASSDAYPHQAFRLGSAYGLQFHVELDEAAFEALGLELPPGSTDAGRRREVATAGRDLLDRWVAALA